MIDDSGDLAVDADALLVVLDLAPTVARRPAQKRKRDIVDGCLTKIKK